MRRLMLLFTLLLAVGMPPAAAHPQAATPDATGPGLELNFPELRMTASDFAFEVSGDLTAGLTLVTLENSGAEPHHAQLMLLNEGQTFDTFMTAMGQDPNAVFGLGQFAGGPGVVDPSGQSQVILDLKAGTYLALCFVESPDGIPHLAKGMVQAFEVGAATGEAASAPETAGTVVMLDFSFEMPAEIATGPQIWEVVNEGPQPHEIALLKLAPGLTGEQAMDMLLGPAASPEAGQDMASPEAASEPSADGPQPFTSAGGMQALASGLRGWVVLDLEPGEYLAVCFVPDPASGQPHTMLGMITAFTVT